MRIITIITTMTIIIIIITTTITTARTITITITITIAIFTDIMKWNAVIFGPDDTPWEGGTFKLEMSFTVCLLSTVSCLLSAICCLLFAVCCLLSGLSLIHISSLFCSFLSCLSSL
jgi:hypothetical protein